MKKIALTISAIAAAAVLSACADGRGRVYASGGTAYYDGYYDNHYGPFYDGYWSGATFYYRDHPSHEFRRDEGGHFRHENTSGFHHFHGRLNGQHRHDEH